MKALVISADGFEDSELYYPLYRLREENIDVDLAAPKSGPITGKHGYSLEANIAFSDISADDYDMLVIPGGKGPETVRQDRRAVEAARRILESGKPVASICHGIQVLISADVLEGRRATCWSGVADDLKAAGGQYEDSEVVVDGNLITSRCPDDLPAFCREMFKAIRQKSRKVA
jgi:protease I